MKRTPLKRGSTRLNRRQRLAPMSDKRKAELPERQRVRAAVLKRDGFRCQYPEPEPPCFGVLGMHHLRKASAGGDFVAENLLTLCNRHNDLVEEEPDRAHALGLVVRHGEGAPLGK